jgi:two-component system, sensor histidine kinase and response regulator
MKLLYLEDNPVDATRVQGILKKSETPIDVHWVQTLEKALQSLEHDKYDAILSDLNVTDSSGLNTFSQIKGSSPETPIVILSSSFDGEEVALEAIQKGAQDFVVKNLSEAELLRRVILHSMERKKLELELRQMIDRLNRTIDELVRTNSELERFVYLASHDLREPLRTVRLYGDLLEQEAGEKLNADARSYLSTMVSSSKRMEDLVLDVLAYSRVSTQGRKLTNVDFNLLLERVLENLSASILESKARITHDPLPTLRVNDTEFLQVFQNLIGNAIKFRDGREPAVHISARRVDESWLFVVKDNGIGIEPRYHDKIFEIFQRLHTMDAYSGTGIGLAICRKVVENHGGRIWVESRPNEGSEFHFTVPVHRSDSQELATAAPQESHVHETSIRG